jgi:hypothetical protein
VQRRDRCASSQDTGKRGEQFSEDAPCIGSILQITLDDSVLGYEQHPQQAHVLPSVFGTLFHKVIVVQLSGSRNTVFAEVL